MFTWLVEPVNNSTTVSGCSGSVQALVLKAAPLQVVLQDIQAPRHCAEHKHLQGSTPRQSDFIAGPSRHSGQHRRPCILCVRPSANHHANACTRLVATGVQADEQLVQQVQLSAQAYICWQLVLRERCLNALRMQPAA
jgi:hypothetical protein